MRTVSLPSWRLMAVLMLITYRRRNDNHFSWLAEYVRLYSFCEGEHRGLDGTRNV